LSEIKRFREEPLMVYLKIVQNKITFYEYTVENKLRIICGICFKFIKILSYL